MPTKGRAVCKNAYIYIRCKFILRNMKQIAKLGGLVWLLMMGIKGVAQPCNFTGTYTIGPGGNYSTITAALSALRTNGLGGPVILELKSGYLSGLETFPLNFANIPCISATRTLTLRPEAGASGVTIGSNIAGSTISLANSRYITIDGRPGGVGTTPSLGITNSSVNGNAVSFSEDASYNTLTYVNILGANTSGNNGVVFFSSSAQNITLGNSYNTISNCSIGNSSGNPLNCVLSLGSTGRKNTGNKILNCRVLNFYAASSLSTAYGIYIGANNAQWEINGNSFYQTVARGNNSANFTAININDTLSGGFVVQNNFIGGTAPNGTGAMLSYNGHFTGIRMLVGAAPVSTVQGNTVANINWRNYLSSDLFNGILLTKGNIDCNGNTIGSQTQQASIITTSSYSTAPTVNGILVSPNTYQVPDSFVVRNNAIGGIRTQQDPTNYRETFLRCIAADGLNSAYVSINANTIGSPTVSNSIETTNAQDLFTGIVVNVTGATTSTAGYNIPYYIANNTLVNMIGRVTGIAANGGLPQLTGNTIRRIMGGVSTGIQLNYAGHGTNIKGNTIHTFISSETSGGLLAGILLDFTASANISGNLIHSFENANGYAELMGIRIANSGNPNMKGLYQLTNNMISLGADSSGTALPNRHNTTGILVPIDSAIIAHNSIAIGGRGADDAFIHALVLNRVATNNCRIVNNILYSSRYTTLPGLYRGAVIKFDAAITDLNGVALNNNIYYSANANTPTAIYKGVGYLGIAAWRTVSGRDSNSVFYNPNFINAEGSSNTVNLHLANPNPAEGQGLAEATVTTDFDEETRSNLSPVDIGADAGNFSLQDGDAPVIKHANFGLQQVGTVVTYQVSITDNGTGVDTSGGNKPRMWFRKTFPTVGSWQSVPGNLTLGTTKGGTWGFTPDYAAAGMSVAPGDSIAYYFVAQDLGPVINIGYSNAVGTLHTSVNAQVTAPTTPLRLLLYGVFPDTVYVGAGQTYTSLTNDGGFFQAAKSYQFGAGSTNAQVIITSNLMEMGTHIYTMLEANGSRVRIGTNTPVVKTIRNQVDISNKPLILLSNVYNLTIDGSVNGSGRYLEFINTNNAPNYCEAVMGTANKLYDFNVHHCIFGSNTIGSFYFMFLLSGQDMRKIYVHDNLFSSASTDPAGLPAQGLAIAPAATNDTIVVKNNDFVSFNKSGLLVLNSASNTTQKGLVLIDSNHFYSNGVTPTWGHKELISVANNKVPVLVRGNFIGGTARFCGGEPWVQTDAPAFKGIYYQGSYDTVGSIQGNVFSNIQITGNGALNGIYITDGIFNVGTEQGNRIGSTVSDSGLVSSYVVQGIVGRVALYQIPRPLVRIENNIIAGTVSGRLHGIDFEGRRALIQGNKVYNHRINNSFLPTYTGLRVWADSGSVSSNTVYGLNSQSTSTIDAHGIDAVLTGPAPGTIHITRNRIYDLRAINAAQINGIKATQGQYRIENNQISLSNGSNTNNVPLRGIYLNNSSSNTFTSSFHYNSCVISGSNGGAAASHGILIDGSLAPITAFANNLLVNRRSGGPAFALGMVTNDGAAWPAGNAYNNMYVVADTNAVNQWRTTGAVNMTQWRSLSQGDGNSTALTLGQLPPDSLFVSWASGNLDINPNTAFCWKLNQKGKPVATIGSDYGAINVRSVDMAIGKTDIGADEFDANTPEPPVVNSLCPGGSTSITSDIVGSSHQWQVNTGSGFVNITNGGAYSGATTATLSISAVPSAWYGYQYRCVVNGSANSQLYALRFANVWTGAVGSAWEDAGNWSCGVMPDGNTDVTINSGSYVILSQNGICRSLTIKPGSVFTIMPGVVLTITQ